MWEYKKQSNVKAEQLNDLGKLRWELISVYKEFDESNHTWFIFKRPLI